MTQRRFAGLTLALAAIVLTSACGRSTPPVVSERDIVLRDSVLSIFDSMDRSGFDKAFDRLSTLDYSRLVVTEQFDRDENRIAMDTRMVRVSGSDSERTIHVDRVDSSGAVDFGMFKSVVSDETDTMEPDDVAAYVLPDDVDFASPRNVDKYTYRFLTETTVSGQRARLFEIRAREGYATKVKVQRVTFALAESTGRLLSASIMRVDDSLLFTENSLFFMEVAAAPDGSIFPSKTHMETRFRTPFGSALNVSTTSTYTIADSASFPAETSAPDPVPGESSAGN